MIQSSLGLTSSVEQTFAPLTTDERATADTVGSMQKQIDQLKEQIQRVAGDLDASARSPTSPRARGGPGSAGASSAARHGSSRSAR